MRTKENTGWKMKGKIRNKTRGKIRDKSRANRGQPLLAQIIIQGRHNKYEANSRFLCWHICTPCTPIDWWGEVKESVHENDPTRVRPIPCFLTLFCHHIRQINSRQVLKLTCLVIILIPGTDKFVLVDLRGDGSYSRCKKTLDQIV